MDNTLLSPDSVVETTQNQLITLVDEAPPATDMLPYHIEAEQTNTSEEVREHTIRDFLQREIKIASGEIDTTMTTGAVITTLELPGDYLKHPMIAKKIDGFRFIRGSFEVRVIINAQPFQAGIMKLLYFPVLSPNEKYNSALSSMLQMSGLCGIDVNFEDKAPLVLKIPFIYPLPSYDMLLEPDPYAYVRLVVYSPLSVGTVSYTMFCRFDDVQISMPISTMLPVVKRSMETQYGIVFQQMMESDSEEEVFNSIPIPRSFRRFDRWFLMGLLISVWCFLTRSRGRRYTSVVRQQIGGEEKQTKPGGLISGIASAVHQVSSTLSGVPFLSSIAGPVSTISGVVANLASAFGWSSPRSEQVATQNRPTLLYGMNNFNRSDNSNQLALDALCKTDVTGGLFGTDLDEMSFKALWYMPQYISDFSVSLQHLEGALLFKMKLNPITLGTKMNLTGNSAVHTNLAYITSCFELYRGSLCFNFKMAKTNFHSVRLAIVYFNNETGVDAEYGDSTIQNYQIIWDIRESYQQTVCIPYIQAIEWLNTTTNFSQFKTDMGYIGVYILNRLQVGGTAVGTIQCLVEMFAGLDYEVAIPRNPSIEGYWIKPVTVVNGSIGQISVLYKQGLISQANVPWYSTPTVDIKEGEHQFAIPPSMHQFNNPVAVSAVTLHNTKEKQSLDIKFANKMDVVYEVKEHSGRKSEAGPTLQWKPNVLLSKAEVYAHFNDYVTFEAVFPQTSKDIPEIEKFFRVHKPGTSKMKTALLDDVYDIEVSRFPNDKNKVKFDKVRRLKFNGYSEFHVSVVYVLAEVQAENIYMITITNEHGPDNLVNVILKVRVLVNKTRTVAQQIGYTEILDMKEMQNITGSRVVLPNVNNTTIGESIVSVRQLCQRYAYIHYYNSIEDKDHNLGGGYFTNVYVRGMGNVASQFESGVTDYVSHFAPMFRFWAGELRFKFYLHVDNVPLNEVVTIRMFNNYHELNAIPNLGMTTASTVLHIPLIEGFGEVTIPYYNRNNKIIMGDVRQTGLLAPMNTVMNISVKSKTKFKVELYRAIGDNFSFGTKLSAPSTILKAISYS